MSPREFQTWAEYCVESIPKGKTCSGCENYLVLNSYCSLFDEPCKGEKLFWCRRNRYLEQIERSRENGV